MSNYNFIEYTTGGAFNLNLSRRQVESFAYYASVDQFVHVTSKTTQSLLEKGLLEQVPADEAIDPHYPCLRATTEGKLVWQLLKMAGLVKERPHPVYIPPPEVSFHIEPKGKAPAEECNQ